MRRLVLSLSLRPVSFTDLYVRVSVLRGPGVVRCCNATSCRDARASAAGDGPNCQRARQQELPPAEVLAAVAQLGRLPVMNI
jgi:hypothetical protein